MVRGKAGLKGGREKSGNDVNIVLIYDFLKNPVFHKRKMVTNTFTKSDTTFLRHLGEPW